MLARRLTTILPAMTLAEALETTRTHCIDGLTGDRTALVTTRPFRVPHYSISNASMIRGSFVKNVTGLSWQQACFLTCVHGRAKEIFYKQQRVPPRLMAEVSRTYNDVLLPDERSECHHQARVILR
jgi:hypothetical protein